MSTWSGTKRFVREELWARRHPEYLQYSRLSIGKPCIRLIKLENDTPGEILRCHMLVIDLDDKSAEFEYDAVSYTWSKSLMHGALRRIFKGLLSGRPINRVYNIQGRQKVLVCNGKLLRIQENLYDFLIQLRLKGHERLLWIDAVCIEQEGDHAVQQEKGAQLNLMGRIYETATNVLVWLGNSSLISHKRLQALPQRIYDFQTNKALHSEGAHKLGDIPELKALEAKFEEGSWTLRDLTRGVNTVFALFDSLKVANLEYFQRGWIVQEVILAKQLTFFLGSRELSLNRMEQLLQSAKLLLEWISIIRYFIGFDAGFIGFLNVLKARSDRLKDAPWSIGEHVSLVRDQRTTLPEDKVFAVLGLVNQDVRRMLQTKDALRVAEHVYLNCTMAILSQASWNHVLSLVGKVNEGLSTLPSWIPDYSTPLSPRPFRLLGCPAFQAATSVPQSFRMKHSPSITSRIDAQLCLHAAIIDEIEQIGESSDAMSRILAARSPCLLLDLVNKVGRVYPITKELTMSALMATFTANALSESDVPEERLREEFSGWLGEMYFPRLSLPFLRMIVGYQQFVGTRFMGVELDEEKVFGHELPNRDTLRADFVTTHDSEEFPMRNWIKPPSVSALAPRNSQSRSTSHDHAPRLSPNQHNYAQSPQAGDVRQRSFRLGPGLYAIDADALKQQNIFETTLDRIYKDRRIFRTKRHKLLGIGSRTLRCGDMVMLIAGIETPYVLRRVSQSPSHFSMLGSCYIRGIMEGEALKFTDTYFNEYIIV